MDFINRIRGGYGGETMAMESAKAMAGQSIVTPRTLREQLQDQIAFHRARIEDLEAAVNSLTPDVERALNALQRL